VTPQVLGQGYFAVVKVGIDKKTGEKVAVKLVNKSLVEKEKLWPTRSTYWALSTTQVLSP